MGEGLTKAAARNIFYGGSLFFLVVFVGLVLHSHFYALGPATGAPLTEAVERGKRVWEENACINCHTLLGEGAYYAPELANVMTRWGVADDPDAAFEILKAWMDSQPSNIEGRRQMPQFNLTDEQVRALAAFLLFVDKIDAQGWPPNEAG